MANGLDLDLLRFASICIILDAITDSKILMESNSVSLSVLPEAEFQLLHCSNAGCCS